MTTATAYRTAHDAAREALRYGYSVRLGDPPSGSQYIYVACPTCGKFVGERVAPPGPTLADAGTMVIARLRRLRIVLMDHLVDEHTGEG